jgi:hypothetical protein
VASPKRLPKCRQRSFWARGRKHGHTRGHKMAASLINESVLPRRPMRGWILSRVSTPRGSANPMPGAYLPATAGYSRWFFPYSPNSPIHPSFPAAPAAQSTPRAAASPLILCSPLCLGRLRRRPRPCHRRRRRRDQNKRCNIQR